MPLPTPSSLFSLIDFAGVFAGAMGGALEAKQNRTYQYDLVGVIGLGLISALGGGITRDILLQHGPPLAFTDVRYLLIALAGALLGLLCGATIHQRIGQLLLGVDAAALGFFAVAGSTRALAAGLTFLPALVLWGRHRSRRRFAARCLQRPNPQSLRARRTLRPRRRPRIHRVSRSRPLDRQRSSGHRDRHPDWLLDPRARVALSMANQGGADCHINWLRENSWMLRSRGLKR